jgi:hypothetical protein
MLLLLLGCTLLALVPAALFRANLRAYAPPPEPPSIPLPPISVLIPARNEEAVIRPTVEAALGNWGVEFEVVVLDDHSEDRTAEIVETLADRDPRLRLVEAPELPPGWCGKQHACWVLAHQARFQLLVFLDADVRLAPQALARMASFLEATHADLASGIPHQETVGFLEKLVIPLIHFVLLGFLPIARMRRTQLPSLSAGCGQLFITRRSSYDQVGGHSAIRQTLHDGIKLPRRFRSAGLKTDLFDATDLATCRMYRSGAELWQGLAKNAGEALAAPLMIVPMSVILLGGQVVPPVLLALAFAGWPAPWPVGEFVLAVVASAASYYPRIAGARRFHQTWLGALLHPLGVLILVLIQWYAFLRNALGLPAHWKGRPYRAASPPSPEPLGKEPCEPVGRSKPSG